MSPLRKMSARAVLLFGLLEKFCLIRNDVRDEFATFLRRSLGIDDDTVSALLWEPLERLYRGCNQHSFGDLREAGKRASGTGFEEHLFS